MSTYFEYLPFEIALFDFSVVLFYFQNDLAMTSLANQLQYQCSSLPLNMPKIVNMPKSLDTKLQPTPQSKVLSYANEGVHTYNV